MKPSDTASSGTPVAATTPAGAALLELLLSRRSIPAQQLGAPGPSPQQIEQAIAVAVRAPDHGALRPWRFVLIQTAAARTQLSELLATRMAQREPDTPAGKLARVRAQPLAAPLVVAIGARIEPEHKVPQIEQWLSVGAGVMNLMQAFHAQGFESIWLTGGNAYDPLIASALGFVDAERSLGLLYVGSNIGDAALPPLRHPDQAKIVREWYGASDAQRLKG